MAGWLRSKVSSFFSGIVNSVKGLLKIHSPSKVFAEIGKFTMLGFAAGMEKTQDTVLKTAERLNNALVKQEEDLQQQLTDMEVAATKRKEAESEKAVSYTHLVRIPAAVLKDGAPLPEVGDHIVHGALPDGTALERPADLARLHARKVMAVADNRRGGIPHVAVVGQ